LLTDFGGSGLAHATAIQTDGKIVAVGYAVDNSVVHFAIARYTTAGALDATFGSGGKLITSLGGTGESAEAVAIQSDG